MNKLLFSSYIIFSILLGQNNQSAVLTTSSPMGSSLTTDSTGIVTNFTVGTASPITWYEYATTFLAFNGGNPLEVNGTNADIWDGDPVAPVDVGFFIPARFEDWSFDGASDNEWHTILRYEDVPNNIDVVGGFGYKLEDPSPTLGAGYVEWTPIFQFTNVHSDTVTIKPFRYLRHTAANTLITYYSNHDPWANFWDSDNIDGTPDDYVVEVKYIDGYMYNYAFSAAQMSHYRIQAYAGNTLYNAISQGNAGYDLTSLTDPVSSSQSEFAFQPEEVTLAQDQSALYWLYPKVILVNNSVDDYPVNIDWDVIEISSSEFNTDQGFTNTDVSINYSSMSYAVNGAGTASTGAKVTVVEITGGMIESGVTGTLESVLDSRYWEVFYDTRRTASMAAMTFSYNTVADSIGDVNRLTVAFRSGYGENWTALDSVVVNDANSTITAYQVDAGAGQWALALNPYKWHVATTGSDETGDGSEDNPFTTIQTAIDSSSDGDIVLVAAGTYVENINFNGKSITVIGDSESPTTIDGGGSGFVVTFPDVSVANTPTLTGFTIRNGYAESGWGDAGGGGIYCGENTTPSFTNLIITGNTGPFGAGIWFQYADPTLTNVTLSNNTANFSSGAGIFGNKGADLTLINCILWNNTPYEISFYEFNDPNSVDVYYSDIQGGQDSIVTNDNGTVTWGSGNIDVDPMFVDTANGNYHLLASSMLINAGHPDSTDSDGTRSDIGAYPYLNTYSGPTWYVSGNGNDTTATGSGPDSFRSIQAAINFASAGDEVSVASGNYFENINFRGRAITVTGSGGSTIDGGGNGTVVTFDSGEDTTTVLSGFIIQNGNAAAGYFTSGPFTNGVGGGILCNGASPILDNLIIKNNIAGSLMAGPGKHGGGIFITNGDVSIQNCIVRNNFSGYGSGIMIHGSSSGSIKNSIIYENTDSNSPAASVHIGSGGGSGKSTSVINTVIFNNNKMGLDVSDGSVVDIVNSIIKNNVSSTYSVEINIKVSSTASISYSMIPNGLNAINNDGTLTWGDGNIDVNPMFVDTSNGNYHLLASSMLINAGHPDSTDSDGTRADIGAFPYLNDYTGPTWYVETAGNDVTGTGSISVPFASIQSAINFATTDGDSVTVSEGTYVENINFRGRNIKVIGTDRETTIIDGGGAGTVVTFENGEDSTAVLSGFTITNGNGSGITGYEGRGGGVFCINSSPTLNNLTVDGNQAENSGAGLWFGYSNSQLVDLIISNNSVVGQGSNAGGGISMNYYSDLTLNNMLLVGNEAVYGAGIELWRYSKPLLNNVTIVGNTGSFGGGLLLSGGCNATLINSILWGNAPHQIMIGVSQTPDSVSISYSNVFAGLDSIHTNDNGIITWGEGNIDVDPMFVDATNGDYHLADWSPCIGACQDGTDMGAYENPLSSPVEHIVIVSDTLLVLEDSSAAIDLQDNDLVLNVTALVLTILDSSSHGNISIAGDTMLTYTPDPDFFGYDTIEYALNGSTANDTGSIFITILNEDDLPVVANAIPDVTVNEDAPDTMLVDLDVVFMDIDDALEYSHTIGDTTLVFASVTNDSATLQFLPDANGSTDIIFTATNPTIRASVSDTMTVILLAVNDAPIAAVHPDTSILEDDTLTVMFSATDVDEDSLSFGVAGPVDNSDITVSNFGAGFNVYASPNWYGEAVIKIDVWDGALADTAYFTLTVNAVDDLPVVANPLSDITVNEDAQDTVLADLDVVFMDIDDALEYSHVVGDTTLVFAAVSNDTVTLQFLPDANGSTNIIFTATNPTIRASVSDTMTITILPVNDAPIMSTLADTTINEDVAIDIILTASDVDGDTLTFSATADTNAVIAAISEDTLSLFTADNWNGNSTIMVIVSDGSGTDTISFQLTVNAVNDAPSFFRLNEQDSVYITMASFASDSIVFTWGESVDIDGDELLYDFTASLIVNGQVKAEYSSSSLTIIEMKIDHQSVFDEIYAAEAMLAGIEWDVSVTDGIEEVMSDNGALTLGVNASAAVLSINGELLPDVFALHQNYPNPFNPVTTLRYDLPENGHVNIIIYDMLGREVKTLINQTQDAGYRSVIWNATNDYGKQVSAGIYLYQIQAGEYMQTKKMVLLK